MLESLEKCKVGLRGRVGEELANRARWGGDRKSGDLWIPQQGLGA